MKLLSGKFDIVSLSINNVQFRPGCACRLMHVKETVCRKLCCEILVAVSRALASQYIYI
jgi:hypothetical protein